MAEARYSFGTPPSGVLLGLGLGRLGGLVIGIAAAGGALAAGLALPVVAVPLVLAGLWCWAPFQGRQVHEWAAPVLRHARVLARGRVWKAPLPWTTVSSEDGLQLSPRRAGGVVAPALPPELGQLSFAETTADGLPVGVVLSTRRHQRLVTAVLSLRGPARFSLSPSAEQDRVISAWGQVLAGLGAAAGGLARVTWVEQASAGEVLAERPMPDPSNPDLAERQRDYSELVGTLSGLGTRHEVHLGLQERPDTRDPKTAADSVAARVRAVAGLLHSAGVASRPLSLGDLAGMLRRHADPSAAGRVAAWGGLDPAAAGPLQRGEHWDHLRIDAVLSRFFVVSAWPKVPLFAPWLEPLLACCAPASVRSIAVHFEGVPAQVASRRAQAGRLNAHLDESQRRSWGFASGARQEAERAEVARREEELVAGHACHRIAAVVSVSASHLEALEEASAALVQAATAARLDLRCAYGSQAAAFAASLPLCQAHLVGGA